MELCQTVKKKIVEFIKALELLLSELYYMNMEV